MTMETLQDVGIYAEETAQKVLLLFEQLAAEKAELEKKLAELEEMGEAEREKRNAEAKETAVEQAILAEGGKNTKAIKALLDLEEISFDGELLQNLNINQVKKAAPYLFYEKEEKIEGTGHQNSKKKNNDISNAFKNALRR